MMTNKSKKLVNGDISFKGKWNSHWNLLVEQNQHIKVTQSNHYLESVTSEVEPKTEQKKSIKPLSNGTFLVCVKWKSMSVLSCIAVLYRGIKQSNAYQRILTCSDHHAKTAL